MEQRACSNVSMMSFYLYVCVSFVGVLQWDGIEEENNNFGALLTLSGLLLKLLFTLPLLSHIPSSHSLLPQAFPSGSPLTERSHTLNHTHFKWSDSYTLSH